jgi:hypothetical protein
METRQEMDMDKDRIERVTLTSEKRYKQQASGGSFQI